MDDLRIISPLGKAELESVFEKIFKNYRVVPINGTDVFETLYDAKRRLWMKKRVSRALLSSGVVGYVIGQYVLVYDMMDKEKVLLVEDLGSLANSPICLFPCIGDKRERDFILRSDTGDGIFTYTLYRWNPEDCSYTASYLGTREPKCIGKPYESSVTHNFNRMYIRKEGTQCSDNTIYFDYIKKYWIE